MEKRKTEDSSCSLLAHFWSTSRSPFSTCYIPFQRAGSQESNASNGARFGVETKELQPLQEKCTRALYKKAAKFSQQKADFAAVQKQLGVIFLQWL